MRLPLLAIALLAFASLATGEEAKPKLEDLLSAKDDAGKPIITPEQRSYYDGLNDRLKEMLIDAVTKERITRAEHLGVLLSLQLRPQKMEVLLENNCLICHSDASSHSADTLFTVNAGPAGASTHMNLREVVDDVHFRRGLSCAGCHGGDPTADMGHDFVKEWPEKGRDNNRAWVVQFCARCHSDPAKMHDFNPSLPTDQLAKFQTSPHGHRLIDMHDDRAPTCISCHGLHGMRAAKDPQSMVYAQRIPETCGACHSDAQRMTGVTRGDGSPLPTTQLAEYRTSVHGKALARGDLGAPRCNTCHGNHAATPPGVATVSRSCSVCHSANASLFDGSKHKQAFDAHHWAECSKCHGNHAIQKTNDQMLATGSGALCSDCHRQFSGGNKDCEGTAQFFHDTITDLEKSRSGLTVATERLASKGLDVEPISNQLSDLTDGLKKSRTYIHSFSRNTFEQVAAPAQEAAKRATTFTDNAREEYKFRQVGLGISIGLIGLLMAAIYVKLRQLEK